VALALGELQTAKGKENATELLTIPGAAQIQNGTRTRSVTLCSSSHCKTDD
jgi:hypothetical protein